MIGAANANALAASGMAAWAAGELRFHGFFNSEEGLREAAAEAVGPLLQSAAIALEISGSCSQQRSAAMRDIILDFIAAAAPATIDAHARAVA